jgi:hypothetical protein
VLAQACSGERSRTAEDQVSGAFAARGNASAGPTARDVAIEMGAKRGMSEIDRDLGQLAADVDQPFFPGAAGQKLKASFERKEGLAKGKVVSPDKPCPAVFRSELLVHRKWDALSHEGSTAAGGEQRHGGTKAGYPRLHCSARPAVRKAADPQSRLQR